ncbi:MAG: family 10 glycosylhydrolase [Erysipelotrichaceae bacterium]|jgi:uncharacterized lipoprotein YddW (UPF0748 family)|nr:family 10 glycosylhydrolase [Erysipelotrichaceae bacterium]
MKKMMVVIVLSLLVSCSKSTPTIKTDYIVGVWFSFGNWNTVLADAPSQKEFEKRAREICENIKKIGGNTLYLHAVAFTDSYYQSSLYPPASTVKDLDYDPFLLLVKEAKKQGILVEAWINPFRSYSSEDMLLIDPSYKVAQWANTPASSHIHLINDRWYLDPASPQVRNLVVSVAQEILQKYDVSGIHLDDYFYPEGIDETFDNMWFLESDYESLKDFRLHQTNLLVMDLYRAVKAFDSELRFGISPSGNLDYNRNTIYADVDAWLSQPGYVDYIIPQIYWQFDHASAAFDLRADQWDELVTYKNVQLIIGLPAYRIGEEGGSAEWLSGDLLARQLAYAKTLKHFEGIALFDYGNLIRQDEVMLKEKQALLEEMQGK